jgi:hypothetical protein
MVYVYIITCGLIFMSLGTSLIILNNKYDLSRSIKILQPRFGGTVNDMTKIYKFTFYLQGVGFIFAGAVAFADLAFRPESMTFHDGIEVVLICLAAVLFYGILLGPQVYKQRTASKRDGSA